MEGYVTEGIVGRRNRPPRVAARPVRLFSPFQSVFALASALLILTAGLSSPLTAQITGRWKISLDRASASPAMGELILSDSGGAPSGRLLLETRDTAWISLSDERVDSAGQVSFVAGGADPIRFDGHLNGDEIIGTATDQQGRHQWRAVRLRDDDEFYAALPRFRQRQLVIPMERQYRIPGRWLVAATRAGETIAASRRRYQQIAAGAGLSPLPPESLGTAGLYRAMGLLNRQEIVAADVRTLQQIRAALGGGGAIQKFDYLFRPQGAWLVDIHDVALARARRPFPSLDWESARPALDAAGLLDTKLPGVETIPLAIYRLFVLSRTDTGTFRSTRERLRQADAASAAAIASLLQGYDEATQWYVAAMRFLVEQRWISGPSGRRSPADRVRETWGDPAPIPDVQVKLFGYPEGAERVGTEAGLFRLIMAPRNAPAEDWLARHGDADLVEALHRLTVSADERAVLEMAGQTYALSSVSEYAAASFGGFLEPRDVILLDPSYQPLMALGTVIHEWQHILHEHRRQLEPAGAGFRVEGQAIVVRALDPFLAEGFAEWLTEVILAPAFHEFPLLAFGEAEKRVCLPDDNPHNLGYLLVRTLAGALADVPATVAILVRDGTSPNDVLRDRRVLHAWSGFSGADRVVARRGDPVLIPQVEFTVDDGQPELIESRIIGWP